MHAATYCIVLWYYSFKKIQLSQYIVTYLINTIFHVLNITVIKPLR